MGSKKEKKGITLLALVITIVIMLLLAGIAIQMTMGKKWINSKIRTSTKSTSKSRTV